MIGSRQAHRVAVIRHRSSGGATVYDPNLAYAAASQVTFGGHTWQANALVAAQHAPQGVGDGSTADRQLLLDQLSRGFAGGLVTGGNAGVTYHVTTAADSGAGSLRAAMTTASALWIVFDGDYTITLASELAMQPNKTIDGRGRNVTIGGAFMSYTNQSMAPNIIFAYGKSSTIYANTANSLPWNFGGSGNGSPPATGQGDLVYVHHWQFTGIRDSSSSTSYVGQNQTRQTYDWCKWGPNPDQSLVNVAGGFKAFTSDAATDTITCTGHGYAEGDIIGTYHAPNALASFPGGMVTSFAKYFARNPTTNTFQVSVNKTGAILDITTNGQGITVSTAGTAPYMAGKGPHFGTNHATGSPTNPPGDPDTGDSVYPTHQDAIDQTNSTGYLRISMTLCDLRNCDVRQPDVTASYFHGWNCRVYKWSDPDGASGNGPEFHDASEAWCHHWIFNPFTDGEAHNWGAFLSPSATWDTRTPNTVAIRTAGGGENCKIQTQPVAFGGGITNWYHGSTENSFTRANPTWTIPYTYSTVIIEADLAQMLDRGAGNIQPWTQIA